MRRGATGSTLWIACSENGLDPETRLLGVPLLRRLILLGERAGFERIVVEEIPGRDFARTLAQTRARVLRASDEVPDLPAGRLVVLSARTLPRKRWLQELREMPVEAGRIEIDTRCAAALQMEDPGETARILRGRGGRDPFDALSRSLVRAPGLLSSRDRLELESPQDLRNAEDWLLAGLVKDTEGFMSRRFERPISLAISRRLAATNVTPNAMTLVSVAVGLAGASLFLLPAAWAPLAGALLVLAHSILDGCDGELARLKFQESRLGGVLDFWGDNVVHSVLFGAIAVAWSRAAAASWPLLLGASAILGTLLSAGFVYRRTMADVEEGPLFTSVSRSPDTRFARMVDALAQRDFLYLLVVLSAFGRQNWFLALAAAGAPIFFLLLLALPRGGRRQGVPRPAGVSVRIDNLEN